MTTRVVNGPTVRALREALGFTGADLARECGISAAFLSNIERGRRQPNPRTARRMAEVLGVSLAAITYPAPDRDREQVA